MELSVVVSTLNDREQLLSCLDALAEHTPATTEVIVVNGPSSDGTTGVVRDRPDVDVLVEISERNANVSRNVGFSVATGDVIAFLDGSYAVEPTWFQAIEQARADGTDVITGPAVTAGDPIQPPDETDADTTTAAGAASTATPSSSPSTPSTPSEPSHPAAIDGPAQPHTKTIAGRSITLINGDNVAFDRTVLDALDGFDEYLETGGDRDCAHRVAGLGFDTNWRHQMAVRTELGADGGTMTELDWGTTYRALSYRLAKNYGPRPTVVVRTVGSALRDGFSGARRIVSGEVTPTGWLSDGTDVVQNAARGFVDGTRARYGDRTSQRNPNGISVRHDRAVRVYDRR
ncbi:glycosyltransferase family 2 protein [Natrialba sp. PRR66]|uniref:glycosyltransferase family 2 protein n=1 Tax=Natrialba sp. PRR66 TaxID=3098146 RepID=UPI002B1D4D7C|nr:glycosyltransferase family 2 protein [Natrialba sp. PRR66]